MIVKVTRGADMAGAVRYLATDKSEVARVNPHVVAGLGRDGEALQGAVIRELAEDLDAPRRMFGTEIKDGHVWACSLAVKNEADGQVGDERWRAIAEDFMRRMDFGDVRWVAVHHGPNKGGHDHVHLLVNMVREDGSKAPEWGYLRRASQAASEVEREHGLTAVEGRELGIGARGHNAAEVGVAERLHGKGTEPARDYIERVVRAASVEAPDHRGYLRFLGEHGVKAHPRMRAGSTEVAGYSYSVAGSARYGGAKLARDLSWPRIQERWANPVPRTPEHAAHRAAGRLADRSLRLERRPGPLARQAHELGRFAQTRAGVPLVLNAVATNALRRRVRAAEAEAERLRDEQDREPSRRPQKAPERGADLGF